MYKKVDQTVVRRPNLRTQTILHPKLQGLTEKKKPFTFILTSPYDADDNSTKLASVSSSLAQKGYGVINKPRKGAKCTWLTPDEELPEFIKMSQLLEGKELTIWVEAHGALGWFFGPSRDIEKEFLGMMAFVEFVNKVAALTNTKVSSVVLNGCFTANEFLNKYTLEFNCSPARMLSMLLPDTSVIGFIGKNASAAINDVYELTKTGFKKISVKPEEASVLYRNGNVVESYTRDLYCNHKYTQDFMARALGLSEEFDNNEKVLYKPIHVMEHLRSAHIDGTGYGMQQLDWVESPPSSSVEVVEEADDVASCGM